MSMYDNNAFALICDLSFLPFSNFGVLQKGIY